jgi:hypothetical protein
MAITTLAGAVAGMTYVQDIVKVVTPALVAGRPHSLFHLAGIPPAAAAPTPGIGGEVLTSYAGQIPFTNPVSGNTYIGRLQAQATIPGTLMLCDLLWHNSGITITSTSEQSFVGSAQIPPRDAFGNNDGIGVFGAVSVSTATGAGTPTLTLKYTNQSGTAGRTATNIVPTVATSAAGAFYPIGLANGDTGIQKAESLTLSATWTSGVIHVVLYTIVLRLELTIANIPNALDAITSGFPRLFDNSVPFLVFIPFTTTATAVNSHLVMCQG